MNPLTPFFAPVSRPLFEAFARAIFYAYCPLRTEGRENLPALPFLVCSNHQSHMDSIVLMVATGHRFSRFGLLAASDYFFRNPLIHHCFAGMVNLIPIPRSPKPAALGRCISLCREFVEGGDRGLILFPEGTRSLTGEIGQFKRGTGLFSKELGLPIVPACIEGTREAMPKGRWFPVPRPVTVRFGAAFPLEADMEYDAIVTEIERRVLALAAIGGDHAARD